MQIPKKRRKALINMVMLGVNIRLTCLCFAMLRGLCLGIVTGALLPGCPTIHLVTQLSRIRLVRLYLRFATRPSCTYTQSFPSILFEALGDLLMWWKNMLLIAVVIKWSPFFGDAKSQFSVRTVYKTQLRGCAHPQSIIGQARDSRTGRVIAHLAQQIVKS